jgi:lethal(2) giant larvae protein
MVIFSGISSLCFTNHGEALYMMSSSEIQRITLSGKKIVSPNGSVDLEDWDEDDENEKVDENKTDDGDENTTVEATTPISAANSETAVNQRGESFL